MIRAWADESELASRGGSKRAGSHGSDSYRGRMLMAARRRNAEWTLTNDSRRREILAMLREAFSQGEQALTGWTTILRYVNALGIRTRTGHPISESVARQWIKKHKFPVLPGHRGVPGRRRRSPVFTTNYIVLAYLVTRFESGGDSFLSVEPQD